MTQGRFGGLCCRVLAVGRRHTAGLGAACPGMQSCWCSPAARGCDPLSAGCRAGRLCVLLGAGGMPRGWWASRMGRCLQNLSGSLQPPWHSRHVSASGHAEEIGAVPGIRETGVIREEAHACIHLSWGDTKEYAIGVVCDVRGLRGTLKYSLLTRYSAPYCLLGLFLKNFWSE